MCIVSIGCTGVSRVKKFYSFFYCCYEIIPDIKLKTKPQKIKIIFHLIICLTSLPWVYTDLTVLSISSCLFFF